MPHVVVVVHDDGATTIETVSRETADGQGGPWRPTWEDAALAEAKRANPWLTAVQVEPVRLGQQVE